MIKDKVEKRKQYLEQKRKYYQVHKKYFNNKRKKYHSEHREQENIRLRKWRNTPRGRFNMYKNSSASLRNIEWDLTFEQFMTFWQKPCYYCGEKIETVGLDRVDNTKGYTINNIVSCCHKCNNWKKNNTQKKFIERCIKIANLYKDKIVL